MPQDQLLQVSNETYKRLKDMGDGTHAEVVVISKESYTDRELLQVKYLVKTAFDTSVVGDSIERIDVLDLCTDTPTTVAVLWKNTSLDIDLTTPPPLVNLTQITQGDSLTLSQLVSAGLATATNQVTQIGYLADLAETNDRHGDYKMVQSEDLGAGTKYLQKSNGTKWHMIKKTYTDLGSQFAYASAVNNTGVTEAQAWTNRATLTYGSIGGA